MQRFFLIPLLLYSFCVGYAQSVDPVFRHLTRSSGLPVDEVTCLAQDSSGFMWLGTREGLYRYDGYTYTGFYNEPGNLQTIPGNYISRIYVDSKGLLWIITNRSGLAVINKEGKVLQVINSSAGSSFIPLDNPYQIKEDRKGFLWCTTNDGLFLFKHEHGAVRVVKRVDVTRLHHATNNLGPFVFDQKGSLWICTAKGLVIYDPVKNLLYNAKNNPAHIPILEDTTAAANIHLDDKKRMIWYAMRKASTSVYDIKKNSISIIYSPQKPASSDNDQMVSRFFSDSRHNLWMATDSGVSVFIDGAFNRLLHQNNQNFKIINSEVHDICEDREGNFWFATAKGISITQPYHQPFFNLSVNCTSRYDFGDKAIFFVVQADSSTLLIGSDKGVYETDQHFTIRKHFRFDKIEYDRTWAYYQDEVHHQIYISTQAGMLLYNIATHSLKKLAAPPFNDRRPVTSFVSSFDGNVWMSHYDDDFLKYNLRNKTFKQYALSALGEEPSRLQLYKNNIQNLWIIYNETGLLRFDEKAEKITKRIVARPSDSTGPLQGKIVALLDLGTEIFIGYVTKGFSLYTKVTRTFRHFSRTDGLVSNSITSAVMAKDGKLWIATSNGLSQFDTATGKFLNYNYDNGMLENNFLSITQLPDGRIAAGTTQGLILFDPDSVNTSRNVPPPVISGIHMYGKELSADSLLSGHLPLLVSYKENYFSIDYISLLYANNHQVEYAYKLQELDRHWIPAGKRRFVSYADLKGGKYHFKVRARLPGTDWVETTFALPVIVSEAFYRRWWFYGSLVLVFAAAVYGLYRYRLQQILHLDEMRTAISSDLHDEVGATLSSISIFSEMAKHLVDTSSKATPYLQRIGERSRESIEKMSDIIWSINPENDSMEQMLARMKNYANEIFEASNTLMHWKQSENLFLSKLTMIKRKNLYLLFKEIINNAAKYSNAENIYIHLHADQKQIKLLIRDDGVGFDHEKIIKGNGLNNIRHRSSLLDGYINIESHADLGTSVILEFCY